MTLLDTIVATASDGAFVTAKDGVAHVHDAAGRPVFDAAVGNDDAFLGVSRGGRFLAQASTSEATLTLWSAAGPRKLSFVERLAALYEDAGMLFARPQSWGPPVFTDDDRVITHHESAILIVTPDGEDTCVAASPDISLARCTYPLDRELAAVACSRNRPGPANATLFVVSMTKGDVVTRALPHAGTPLGAVRVGDAIASIDAQGCHFFDAGSGAELVRVRVPGSPCQIAALSDGSVAIATRDGVVWTFKRGDASATAHAKVGDAFIIHLRGADDSVVVLSNDGNGVQVARSQRLEGAPDAPAVTFEATRRSTAQALFVLATGDVAKSGRLLAWVTPTAPLPARILREFAHSVAKEENGTAFALRLDGAGISLNDDAVRAAFLALASSLRDLESYVLAYYAWIPVARAAPERAAAQEGIALARALQWAEGSESTYEEVKGSLARVFPNDPDVAKALAELAEE